MSHTFIPTRICRALAVAFFVGIAALTARAVTIDFGTQWDFPLPSEVIGYADASPANSFSTETQIKTLLNSIAGTSFDAADIHKTNSPSNVGGQFSVGAGWNYLVVQYDGPNGGSVVIELNGADALVPYYGSNIWGTGTQYGVSHFSVAGQHQGDIPGVGVPDGGTTALLLGLGLIVIGCVRRKIA